MGVCDESEEEHSFMKDLIPNLGELESTIRESLGFEADAIEEVIAWLQSDNEEPLDARKYAEAINLIEYGLEYAPPGAMAQHKKTLDTFLFLFSCLAKDTDRALSYYTTILEENPDDYELALNCAEGFLVALQNYTIAKGAYQGLVKMRPDDFDAHFNLGVSLLMTGDYKGAKFQSIKCFQLAAGDELKKEQWSALYWDSKKQLGERTEYGSLPEEQQNKMMDFMKDLREVD